MEIELRRSVLLFEIARRCNFADCNKRTFIGLIKEEALEYVGFECSICERWNDDSLTETDIPDWWSEVSALRGHNSN